MEGRNRYRIPNKGFIRRVYDYFIEDEIYSTHLSAYCNYPSDDKKIYVKKDKSNPFSFKEIITDR